MLENCPALNILYPILFLKLIYSEKAKIFCEISTNYLPYLCTSSQIIGGDFAKKKFFRIYEL